VKKTFERKKKENAHEKKSTTEERTGAGWRLSLQVGSTMQLKH